MFEDLYCPNAPDNSIAGGHDYGRLSRLVELNRLYDEARDNVRFLTTLERHFKVVQHGTFDEIQETMREYQTTQFAILVLSCVIIMHA